MVKRDPSRKTLSDEPGVGGIKILDLKGMIAPLTFLKITHAFREIKTGEIIEIIGTDPETRRNFSKVLGETSYELLNVESKKGLYLIRLRKGCGQGSHQ